MEKEMVMQNIDPCKAPGGPEGWLLMTVIFYKVKATIKPLTHPASHGTAVTLSCLPIVTQTIRPAWQQPFSQSEKLGFKSYSESFTYVLYMYA